VLKEAKSSLNIELLFPDWLSADQHKQNSKKMPPSAIRRRSAQLVLDLSERQHDLCADVLKIIDLKLDLVNLRFPLTRTDLVSGNLCFHHRLNGQLAAQQLLVVDDRLVDALAEPVSNQPLLGSLGLHAGLALRSIPQVLEVLGVYRSEHDLPHDGLSVQLALVGVVMLVEEI